MKHSVQVPQHKAAPSGFGRVATRISSWTSKAILTVVILGAGFAVGREVLNWWGSDAGTTSRLPATVALSEGLGNPAEPHLLQFGDQSWSFTQQVLSGSAKEAAAALRAGCRNTAASAALPADPPGPAEQDFLRSIARLKPVEEVAGEWQLYELERPFPMVAGVRLQRGDPDRSTTRRVVTWGLAIPKGSTTWASYCFHQGLHSGGQSDLLSELELPPGALRILAVHVSGGGGVLSFRGPSEVDTWKQSLDSWLSKHDWKPVGGWRQYGSNWHLCCENHQAGPDASLEIHFGPDGRGGQTGLLILVPSGASHGRK